jgi:hypothetical protein
MRIKYTGIGGGSQVAVLLDNAPRAVGLDFYQVT